MRYFIIFHLFVCVICYVLFGSVLIGWNRFNFENVEQHLVTNPTGRAAGGMPAQRPPEVILLLLTFDLYG